MRLSEEVIKTLTLKSRAINMNKTEYVTKAILDSYIKEDNSKDIARLIGSINKIGNNINQIAYNLNIAKNNNKLGEQNFEDLLNKLIIIEYKLKEVLKNKQ